MAGCKKCGSPTSRRLCKDCELDERWEDREDPFADDLDDEEDEEDDDQDLAEHVTESTHVSGALVQQAMRDSEEAE